jgi:hypothetical protein
MLHNEAIANTKAGYRVEMENDNLDGKVCFKLH